MQRHEFNSSDLENSGYDIYNLGGANEPRGGTLLAGVIGAIVGALPGMLLWVGLLQIGYVASLSGLLIAYGTVFGYSKLSKSDMVNDKIGWIICITVIIIAMFLGTRFGYIVSFHREITDSLPAIKDEIVNTYLKSGMTSSEINDIITDDWVRSHTCEKLGIKEITLGECSRNFSNLLDLLKIRGGYMRDVLMGYLFGGLGAFSIMKKR